MTYALQLIGDFQDCDWGTHVSSFPAIRANAGRRKRVPPPCRTRTAPHYPQAQSHEDARGWLLRAAGNRGPQKNPSPPKNGKTFQGSTTANFEDALASRSRGILGPTWVEKFGQPRDGGS